MLDTEQAIAEAQARIDRANEQQRQRDAARMAEFETVETFIDGRRYFSIKHKDTGLGYWSHFQKR